METTIVYWGYIGFRVWGLNAMSKLSAMSLVGDVTKDVSTWVLKQEG